MKELGLALPVETLGIRAAVDLGVAAERAGFGSVWSSEVAAADAFSPLAALAPTTERVRLCAGVVPAGTRPVALLAMSAAALAGLSGGRFVLGVGTSSRTIVEDWMDAGPYEPAQLRVRETIEALRTLLTGTRTSYPGTTIAVTGFTLAAEPAWVPILVGALHPGSYRLAGEVADGVVATLTVPERLAQLRPHLTAGSDADLELACRVVVSLDGDDAELRPALRRMLAGYGAVPAYNASFRDQGFADEARLLADAWSCGDRDGAECAVSDAMLAALTVSGADDDVAAGIARYWDAGADTVVLVPVTAAPHSERAVRVKRAIERIGRQVA